MSSLAAIIENIKYYKENNVCKHLWNYGENFKTEVNIVSRFNELESILAKPDPKNQLKIKFRKKNLIICFHPETLKKNSTKKQIKELLNALRILKDTSLIFTGLGQDLENKIIIKNIEKFVRNNDNAYYFTSLGQLNYFPILNLVDAIVGNSSSGILEMPILKKATINIGERQLGRLKCKSIIDCKARKKDIITALSKIYSKSFKNKIITSKSPYEYYGATAKIIKILKKINLKKFLFKKFYDIYQLTKAFLIEFTCNFNYY
jgi:GDP/UDP-N,N'-diacetylbacillosamine 2-epimerase (hydrolysing)